MKKILLICNLTWNMSDFRYGLMLTLANMAKKKNVRFRHNYLADNFEKNYLDFKPDIIISVKKFFSENEYKLIDKNCIKIQWNVDDPDCFQKYKKYIPQFDYWLTNSFHARDMMYYPEGYRNVKVCGFACSDKLYDCFESNDKYKSDIIFAGNQHKKKYRIEYLNALSGLDLKVYGKWNKPVYGYTGINLIGTEYIKALKSAKIGLDFALSGSKYLNVKSKIFELACAGCMIMVDDFPEMENYFEYEKEIVGFKSPEDLREKVEYYLKHDSEREKIARAGRERFLKCHTWEKRLNYIFNKCEVKL